jgi:N-acylneuraminate cytidylyltransferase/CMP-N,N'-diacetyllegionaminic acid synthase
MMLFCGKPLIHWTIVAALDSFQKESIVVSSDSNKILDYAEKMCVQTRKRPKELATDDATTYSVVSDVLLSGDWQDDIIVLQPTSPLRLSSDINGAVHTASFGGAYTYTVIDNVISLYQVCDSVYRPNGAIYIVKKRDVMQHDVHYDLAYIMPKERSIDIDTIEDFIEAERLMYARNKL